MSRARYPLIHFALRLRPSATVHVRPEIAPHRKGTQTQTDVKRKRSARVNILIESSTFLFISAMAIFANYRKRRELG